MNFTDGDHFEIFFFPNPCGRDEDFYFYIFIYATIRNGFPLYKEQRQLIMHEFFIIICTANSSCRHLQKRIGKKGIEKTVGMGLKGESPMLKSAIDFSILREISHKIVCILHT